MLAAFALGTWLTSLALPNDSGVLPIALWPATWWWYLTAVAQITAVACLLIAVFACGMCLAWPAFPTGQWFVAVSLNGQPIIRSEPGTKLPTLQVGRGSSFYRFQASGTGHCNGWWGEIALLPPNFIVWSDIYRTAVGCAGIGSEEEFFRALLGATRWRRQGGHLILENGADILRFALLQ